MRVNRNNKGYSLIELMITIAIFSIIMVAIILMMRTSVATYKEGVLEADKQEEAQIVANQISDLLVDATKITDDTADDGDGYEFEGPNGSFELYQSGKKLYLQQGGTDHVLSDCLATDGFSIDGLSTRSDNTSTPDNSAIVKIGIDYKGNTYSATKVSYFRNEIEDDGEDAEGNELYSPFDVTKGPTSVSGGGGSGSQTKKLLRYHPLDISAEYDIVYDASLSADAKPHFVDLSTTTSSNSMIKNSYGGMDKSNAKHYILKLASAYETPTGYDLHFGGNNIYVSGKNSKGQDVTVYLELEPVSLDVGAGVFSLYYGNDENNDNGFPTYITAKGIHINDAINNGITVSYTAEVLSNNDPQFGLSKTLLAVGEGIPSAFNNSNYIAADDSTDPNLAFNLGVCPNYIDGGIAMSLTGKRGYGNIGNDHLDFLNTNGSNDNRINFKFTIGDATKTEDYECDYILVFGGTDLSIYN